MYSVQCSLYRVNCVVLRVEHEMGKVQYSVLKCTLGCEGDYKVSGTVYGVYIG